MTTRGWVFVLFVIVTGVAWSGTNTSLSDSPAEHDCTLGLRHADNDGHTRFIFKAVMSGMIGQLWNLPDPETMEGLQRSGNQLNNSLSVVAALLNNITHKDCGAIYRSSKGRMDSGVYTIHPRASPSGGGDTSAPLRVFCRVEAGRAWTVIQRRQDGSVDFYNRTWEDYSRGFGNLTGEFWLGNDNIHLLTNQGRYKLFIDYEKFNGDSLYSEYACFRVENEQARYKLHLGSHSGTSNPHLWYHRGHEFKMNPCAKFLRPSSSCYLHKAGGIWMKRCDTLNPNGFYWKNTEDCPKTSVRKTRGVSNCKFIEMKITESGVTSYIKEGYCKSG